MADYIYNKSNGKPTDVEKLTTTFKPNGKLESVREIIKFLQGYSDQDLLKEILKVITDKIPAEASPSNKLADKAYVDTNIATASATFKGHYNLVTDLSLTVSATEAQIGTALASVIQSADNNDYCYVEVPVSDATPTELASVDRYKYNGTTWGLEFSLDKSLIAIKTSDITALTAQQLDALRNGDIVVKITGNHKHTYMVAYKDSTAGECSLVYCDHENIEEVYYEKVSGVWTYIQTDNYNFQSAIAAVVNTIAINDTNGDITIQYDDGQPAANNNN